MIEDGGGGADAVQRAQAKIYEALCQQSVELVLTAHPTGKETTYSSNNTFILPC